MLELRKFVAPEFIFGGGAINLVGRYARNFGARKVFIVTDPGVIKSGTTSKICDILQQQDICYSLFSSVSPNPRSREVMDGAAQYSSDGCDVIVAVGGGSPMDCAKAIGIVTTNGRNVLDFEGIDNVDIPGPPLICIPTTAGTSADVSQFAIISDETQKVKIAIISKTMVPDVALIDPETTVSMDKYLTACTAMDAFVHAFEAYVSTANSPILDLHALNAIRLIFNNLVSVLQKPDDIELRECITLASLEAGLAFSNASLGAVHAMAHSLGGLLDLPHGECNAILLDHVVAYNFPTASNRYRKVAEVMNIQHNRLTDKETLKEILGGIRTLKKNIGIEVNLRMRGTRKTDIPELARKAMKDPCMVTNPRVPTFRDIEVLYEEAL